MIKKAALAAAVAVVLLAAVLVFVNQRPSQPVSFKYDADLGPRPRVKGLDSAPVKVVEFSDFQCPDCGRIQTELQAQLADLIAAGKVQLMFRHVVANGQGSLWAAEASQCAADQGTFWAYHDELYAHQQGESFSLSDLKRFAESVVMDPQKFNSCLDSHSHLAVIQADKQEAERHQVSRAPSFLVNDRLIASRDPAELMKAINEAAR